MRKIFVFILGVAWANFAAGQQQAPAWVSEGPYVDETSIALELPLRRLGSKLHVEVEIGGVPRRFVFDTGSPSMINRALAAELGLEAVDRQQGRDSHGALIESDIVQAELNLGGVTFHKVPMFAADFSANAAAQCLIGDGVLGAEMLPLCAWQIDLPDSLLRCNTDITLLDHTGESGRQRLYDFGYPHLPILDVRFAKDAVSKAMFDTGSPGYFTLSPPDFEGARRAGGIGRMVAGNGSLGGSLGGQAAVGKQTWAELTSLSIGPLALGAVGTVVRESPPSLIGAAMLEHFVVTFDLRSGAAWFDPYREGPFAADTFGFSLAFDGAISVGLVWENSPAATAGLSAGTALSEINGIPTAADCAGIRRAMQAMSEQTIELAWEEGSVTLTRQAR